MDADDEQRSRILLGRIAVTAAEAARGTDGPDVSHIKRIRAVAFVDLGNELELIDADTAEKLLTAIDRGFRDESDYHRAAE